MVQWTGKRAIIKKYQISPKELLHIINKGEVTYSDIDGVLLIDEESFAAYIDALKKVQQKDSVVNRLKRVLHSRKDLELDKKESLMAQRLEGRIFSIYAVTIHALSMLLESQERNIFLAFANGDTLQSIAIQMHMRKETVFYVFENSIAKLDKQAPYIIQKLARRCQVVEEVNQNLINELSECNRKILNSKYDIQRLNLKIGGLERRENNLKIEMRQLQSMFDKERKINVTMGELLETYDTDIITDFFSSIKKAIARLFHQAKS